MLKFELKQITNIQQKIYSAEKSRSAIAQRSRETSQPEPYLKNLCIS